MLYEQIKKLEDGSSVKVQVRMFFTYNSNSYTISVSTKDKGKQTWIYSFVANDSSYRKLDNIQKKEYEDKINVGIAGVDFLNECLLNAWQSIKPTLYKQS